MRVLARSPNTLDAEPSWVRRIAARIATTHYAEWIGLVSALVPVLVAACRAAGTSWRPEYDAAYFATRSLDVFTRHQPLTGGWSAWSPLVGEDIHHLGPIQFLLLAPFTRLDPIVGLAVGVALVNAAAVLLVWVTARRLFGPLGVVVAMLATVLLQVDVGGLALIDARQQLALLLPFWALLWLTTSVALGHVTLMIPWVIVWSFVVQTHLGYAHVGAALAIAGTVGGVLNLRRQRVSRRSRRVLAAAAATVAALWTLPMWDQLVESGNLGRALANVGGADPTGVDRAVRIFATGPFGFPLWLPTTMRTFDHEHLTSTAVAWPIMLVWLGALATVTAAKRRTNRPLATLAGVAFVATAVGVAAAALSPAEAFRSLPQTYFCIWPLSLFAGVAIAAQLSTMLPPLDHRVRVVTAILPPIMLFAMPATMVFPGWDLPDEVTGVAGRRLLDEVGRRLDQLEVELGDAVVVEPVELRVLVVDYYGILGELTSRGIDIHFPASDPNLQRFGTERCEQPDDLWRLRIIVGRDRPPIGDLELVLADLPGPDRTAAARLLNLRTEVATALTDGAFLVRTNRVAELGAAGAVLRRLLTMPADRVQLDELFFALPAAVDRGLAAVPAGLAPTYDDWVASEQGATAAELLVYLTPNYFPVTSPCGSS
jgi:hypothetical protein